MGFLMLGAGTARAFGHAWTLVEQCTEKGSGDRYILKKVEKSMESGCAKAEKIVNGWVLRQPRMRPET